MFSEQSITQKLVTPADAKRLLEATEVVNVAIYPEKLNPPVDPERVSAFAEAMIDGRWRPNGKTIVLDSSGAVLNGQHRLLACVEADCPFETVVVEGISRDARFTIETNICPLEDVVYMMGEQNPWLLASTLASLIRYEQQDPDFDFTVSEMQLYLETSPRGTRARELDRGFVRTHRSCSVAFDEACKLVRSEPIPLQLSVASGRVEAGSSTPARVMRAPFQRFPQEF